MSLPAILEVRGLNKRFDALQAVHQVDLSLYPGEVVSLIGPNGSGKTTTLNLIAGALRPDSGSILLEGVPIAGLAPERIAEAGLTRTFQNGRVFGNSSVRENVLVGLTTRLGALRPFARLRRVFLLRWVALLAEAGLAVLRPARVRKAEALLEEQVKAGLARFGQRLLPRLDELTYRFSYANRRRTEYTGSTLRENLGLARPDPRSKKDHP